MNFAEVFVNQRVLAYMLSAALLLFGVIGVQNIGIDRNPNIDAPFITVTTVNPGASPDVMDGSVTSVIESAVNSTSGIDVIMSRSMPSVSQVMIQFIVTKDPDVAFNEVQSRVNQVQNDLPDDAEIPVIMKMDPNATPVLWMVLKGDRTISQLNQLARQRIKKSLEGIQGVGEVMVGGGRERKIRVDLDLQRMSALGITAQEVIQAFGREHIQLPGGYLVGGYLESLLHLDLEYHSTEELAELVVNWRDQIPVKLRDIAEVSDGLDDKRSLARVNGQEGVAIGVRKVQNANTVAIVEAVQRRLDEAVRPSLPDGVELVVAVNAADIVSGTVSALEAHIVEGTLLAALVVWFYLLNVPATLIIATAIPVSLAGAVVVMYFGGYTFNIMTLSGLLLLIGIVVDDAIVVLENIHRQHESGNNDRIDAAITGTRGVVLPVFAASMTLVCMFGTVIFTGGMIGVFMRSFAVVVVVGVLASLLVSLSLTPALCARFLASGEARIGGLPAQIAAFHAGTERLYRKLLKLCLRFRWTVLLIATAMVGSTGLLMQNLGTEFFPPDDESRFRVELEAPLGSSIDYISEKIMEAEQLLRGDPEVRLIMSRVGAGDDTEVNRATLSVMLVPKSEREASQQELMERSLEKLSVIAGVRAYVTAFPMFDTGEGEPFEVHITGPSLPEVAHYAEVVLEKARELDGLGELRMELKLDRPLLSFDIDRNRAQSLGISTQTIADTIRVVAGGADIAKFNELPGDGERYDVRLASQRDAMRDLRDLENVYLSDAEGRLVRLSAVADLEEKLGPAQIDRVNMNFSAGFYARTDISLGEALNAFRDLALEVLPPGYRVIPMGEADELEKTGGYMAFVFVTGLILVYMVLASQFNSFLQPVLVMSAQPLAIIGGVFALWLLNMTLNIYSMIGLVLLVGLVSKNSILLIDLVNRYRRTGLDADAAIHRACPQRMRPVMMTSLTIVLAMMPAAVGVGAGAGQYGPLAVAVIGGVISSTLLTLVVVPVSYSLMQRWLD
jgi:HAE1 family hydrophobic/amphiphilic exporter-1